MLARFNSVNQIGSVEAILGVILRESRMVDSVSQGYIALSFS
jgi:hypothetical protein